jgi:hypothetical protein
MIRIADKRDHSYAMFLTNVDVQNTNENKRPMGHIAHLSNLGQYKTIFSNIKYAFHFHLPHPTLGGN